MSKLKHLVTSIKRDSKMSMDDMVHALVECIEDCDHKDYAYIYKMLYERAYGNTLTKEVADEWVKSMDVTDGSGRETGVKFTMDKAVEYGNSVGVDWTKIDKPSWFVAMNMAYSDQYSTARKYGHEDDPIFFAMLAKAEWLDDHDVKGKSLISYYFKYVA